MVGGIVFSSDLYWTHLPGSEWIIAAIFYQGVGNHMISFNLIPYRISLSLRNHCQEKEWAISGTGGDYNQINAG